MKSITSNQNQPKKKKNGKQQQKKPAPPRPSNALSSAYKMRLVSAVCGLTDPFCEHARGAKYPDNSSTRTLPYTYRFLRTVTSNASGTYQMLWIPQYGYEPFTVAATGTAPSVTSWTAFSADSMITGAETYRIVSSGFRLSGISAPLSAAGIVSVRAWPATDGSGLGTITTNSYNASQFADVPLRNMNGFSVITPHSSADADAFYAVPSSGAVSSWTGNGYNPVTILVTGAPNSTDVMIAECFIHFELTFTDSTGLSQAATRPPPANSVITDAASRVTSQIPAFIENGVKRASAVVMNAAISALALKLGGPQAAAMSTAIMVD